ncbi:hypothetical protein [Woodsholea maritima]|uniref:hypothetical protein n=1 Tax=Woodsholea maritima TaxID=240237 RepID=UPI00035D10E6|nr:hypothetical protein [Woodsholea maritima]
MGIRKSTKIWASVSAAALLTSGALSACSQPAPEAADTSSAQHDAPAAAAQSEEAAPSAHPTELAGEGGEGGGEGGEAGGEMGIDPEEALRNPVVYRSAIEVMRAHYIAGLAAMEMGDRANASALFSHPISEIYIDLEPVIEQLGGQVMMDELNQAAVLHFQGASEDEIIAAVNTVTDLLDANLAVAPNDGTSEAHVRAAVIGELIERASLQYAYAVEQEGLAEAWLDGYGLVYAADRANGEAHDMIVAEDSELAAAIDHALELLMRAYDSASRPETLAVDPAQTRAAAQAVLNALKA